MWLNVAPITAVHRSIAAGSFPSGRRARKSWVYLQYGGNIATRPGSRYFCPCAAAESGAAMATVTRRFRRKAVVMVGCLYHKTMLLEPVLEHHQYPDHRPVVARVALDVDGRQLVDELRADEIAFLQIGEAVERELSQRRMRLQPRPERQPEPVLGLGDDLVWQEPAQRFLEEVTQPRTLELEAGRKLRRERDDRFVEQGKAHIDAGELAGTRDLGEIVVGERKAQ